MLFLNILQDVSADLMLNRGNSEWWSFHNVNLSDVSVCGGLTGPMAIIVSEETPRKCLLVIVGIANIQYTHYIQFIIFAVDS